MDIRKSVDIADSVVDWDSEAVDSEAVVRGVEADSEAMDSEAVVEAMVGSAGAVVKAAVGLEASLVLTSEWSYCPRSL